ncbi:glycerophosphodiester phosphodiesterase family protein [Pseudolysinimonas sp.]|uniref:glycerophosphodiester phosphodiesterase family protein n=1 Tax=Pseudolysinimonas sp. TaxID=2680009 RepID=UPI00286C98B5|nr:glycerophosphodiester phosphodiesterase family protein [Pseudolysinimonas sp.]
MSEFFTPAPPRVLAHRGLALDAPENTLLAFAKATAIGVTHLETDVHGSADGVAMISHDPDLFRLAGRKVRVGQLTSHELRRIQLGEGQGFCSLAEALDAFPESRFNIDIKAQNAVVPTVKAILAAGATDRVLIGSFSPARRLAAVRQLPGVATSISSRGAVAAVTAARSAGGLPTLRRILRDVHAVQLPLSILRMSTVTARTIAAFHAAGVEVHAWTINDDVAMDRLLDLGVDGLVSDRSDLAIAVLSRRSDARS